MCVNKSGNVLDAAQKHIYTTGIDRIAVYNHQDAGHFASAEAAATFICGRANPVVCFRPEDGNRDSAILVFTPR